jgi:Transcription activator MBF2
MAQFSVVVALSAVLLLGAVSSAPSDSQPGQLEATFKFVDNIEAFKQRNADLNFEPLTRSVGPRQQIRYTAGTRISGDRLVAQDSKNQSWPTLQDVQLVLTYPVSGLGATVTYMSVTVNQASAVGRAYIVSGGIGQRNIQVVVEGKSTNYFNYTAQIYGY